MVSGYRKVTDLKLKVLYLQQEVGQEPLQCCYQAIEGLRGVEKKRERKRDMGGEKEGEVGKREGE